MNFKEDIVIPTSIKMDYHPYDTENQKGYFEKKVKFPGLNLFKIPTVVVDVNDMYLITYGCVDPLGLDQVQEINFYTRDLTRGRCLDVDVAYMKTFARDQGVSWDEDKLTLGWLKDECDE